MSLPFDSLRSLRASALTILASSVITLGLPSIASAQVLQMMPVFEALKPDQILSVKPTATGKRVLIEAHGEILSAPAEKGDIRNLTQSPGVADRYPAAAFVAKAREEGAVDRLVNCGL